MRLAEEKSHRCWRAALRTLALRAGLACVLLLPMPGLGADVVRIGVLAYRPKGQTLEQWRPLAIALKQALPERDFVVQAFTYPELTQAVATRSLDIVLTNPAHFVLLKKREGLSAPLATLVIEEGGRPTTTFGGVIFCRSGQTLIRELRDLKGRSIAFPGTESLGGYQMQAFELSQIGISLPGDATLIVTGVPHDNAVEAVLTGRADVGFVREGVLEGMAREGRLDLGRIQVINRQVIPGVASQLSTRLYPEWPIAALRGTDKNLVRRVASALLGMEEKKAGLGTMGIHGFGVAADYTPVEDLLRELRLPPFDVVPHFTAKDIWSRYHWQVLAGFAAVGSILFLTVRLLLLNRRLDNEKRTVQQERESLAASQAENQALISAIPDLIFTNHRDGEFLAVHASDPSQLLAPTGAFLHRQPSEVLPPPLADQFMRALADAQALSAVQEFHYSLPVGGHDRHFEARVVASSEDRIITIVRDVTERKGAEEALSEAYQLNKEILQSAQEGVIVYGLDLRYQVWNPFMEQLTGKPASEVLGKLPLEVFPFLSDVGVIAKLERVLAGGVVESIDFHFKIADTGKSGWVANTSAPLRNSEGAILGVISNVSDISERKQAEEEKDKLQAQLQQSQRMESLGILAGGVAHDMNNVLGAILGLASAHLGTQPTGSPLHRSLDTICKATERGGKMIKGLLGFARQSPVENLVLDVNAILKEQVDLLERTTLAKVHLRLDLEPELRPIRGDASALTHAFMNLCINAVDAIPEDGTLTLRTRNVDNGWIEVAVEDTGMGMSREVLAKAIDPFFTTKDVGKGTGLGLSLVHGTVKAHRGQLAIESEPDKGTRVRLRFPACEHEAQVWTATSPVADPTLTPKGGLKVLLVDDDDLIQVSVQMVLEVLGHTAVSIAQSGEEALAALEAGFEPDLIILDMNMPGLGGIGTLPRLRRLRPAVPVILATGRVDQSALDLASAHPGVTLLSKPFGLIELQNRLEKIGQGRGEIGTSTAKAKLGPIV